MSGATTPSTFIADPTDPLLGWASTTELDLSRQLSDIDLAVSVQLTGDELERLDRFWGLFITRQLRAGADIKALQEACPALFAVTLVGRAGRIADLSNFYAEYWAGLGVPEEVSEDLTDCFEGKIADILSRAGLDPLDVAAEGPDGELGRLLLHAELPAGWIPAVMALIDADPAGITGAEITEHFAHNLPTRQVGPLCTLMPEKATELFDGIIGFYRWVGEHPYEVDQWGKWGVSDDGSSVVPPLILEDLVDELRERPVGTEDRLSTVGTASWETSPRLLYDVPRERVVLRLPQMPLTEAVSELRWHVSIDGDVTEYRTGLDHDAEGFSEILDVPIRKAARKIVVTEVVRRVSWTIPVVDEPFLAFTMRGQDVTRKLSWHHADLIMVTPDDAEIRDLVRETPLPTDEGVELRGWNGWIARTVDLAEAASVEIRRPDQPSGTELRSVDPRQRVTFVESALCEYIRSDSGLPVHAESLMAEFPPTVSGSAETWYLSVASYAGPGQTGVEVTPQEPLEVPAEGGAFYVFDPDLYESPWVGEYIVRLSGPRNESFRHRYAIVEGLTSSVAEMSDFRIPVAGGLTPITVSFGTEKPCGISPNPLQIPASDARGSVTISTEEGDLLPIRVTPPRLLFQVPLKGEEARWRSTPLTCSGAELNGDMHLRVRTGTEIHKPVITARDRHGTPVRTKKMTTWDGVTWRVPLRDFAASLAVQTGGRIELSWLDTASRKTTSVRLVTLAPTPSWQLSLADGVLTVSAEDTSRDATSVVRKAGAPDGRGLGVWVWPATAPWRRALSLPVTEGAVALPDELINVGPLLVQVFCADASENLRAPARPGPQAITVEQEGFATGQGLDSLSAFLAGESQEIEGGPDTFTLLWDLQSGWMSDFRAFAAIPQGAELVRKAFAAHPTDALSGLANSLVDSGRRPGLLISSGLVRCAFGPSVAEDTAVPWIAGLGLLADAARLDAEQEAAAEGGAPEDTTLEAALAGANTGDDAASADEDSAGSDGETVHAEGEAPAATDDAEELADNGNGVAAVAGETPVKKRVAVRKPAKVRADVAEGDEAPEADNTVEASSPARMRSVVLEKLQALVGQRAVEAYTTGRDQSLDNACLDRNTVHIAQMPEAQQQVILKQFLDTAGIVPGPLSEDNSRLLAVLETFSCREELTKLLGEEALMLTAAKLLKRVRHANRQLYAAARVRFDRLEGVDTESDSNRWALAPIVSLVFALAARIEAHGAGTMGELSPKAVAGWAKVADLLPELVSGDILAADAMVLGVLGHRE